MASESIVGNLSEKNDPGESETLPQERSISFAEAFRYWLKLGFISFGGPAGQIAIMHNDLVDRRKWISEDRFLHALNFCMLLPGPEAQQLAIYIGWLLHRTKGGIVAGVFFVLPSIFILMALSYIYAAYGNVPAVTGLLSGFKPVVVAIVVEAVLKIGKKALKRQIHFLIAAASFIAIFFLHIPFPLIVLAAGIIGLLIGQKANGEARNNQTNNAKEKTVISDDEPPPAHTLPSRARALKAVAICFVLWVVPFAALIVWRGWGNPLAQQYRFFTQAAFVTFGGAYAVLAYVTQAAVESYGWLTRGQAVDGLALAETTPGPLIMVLQFVGFMAGWNNPQDMSQTTSAITSALITTYTTFLPCFFFIFLCAPYIESLRGNRKLTAALSGVTAAVVGVVLNLAFVFGIAVIWQTGKFPEINWFAAAMSMVAFVALYRFKIDVLWVVLTGGVIGLLRVLILG
jgi:chromate transporter